MWSSSKTAIAIGAALGAVAIGVAATWPRSRRVALVGDSLAVGLGPQLAKLAAARGIAFQYEGHVGTTPLQWSNGTCGGSCGGWLAAFSPTIVLVCLGTNDIGYSPSPPIGPYLLLAQRWGAIGQVVWIDPPLMPNDKLAGVRSVIASLGVSVFPAQAGLSFGGDGIHPMNYAPWAESIAAAVFA